MFKTTSKSEFRDAFRRAYRGNQFTYEALGALYDYLEEIYQDNDNPNSYELDVIGICCEFSEEPIKDVLENYSLLSLEELHENTSVVWDNGENVLYVPY